MRLKSEIKDYIKAYIILLLERKEKHGYLLAKEVQEFMNVDTATIYRVLKCMEKENILSSREEKDKNGRWRKIYSLNGRRKETVEDAYRFFKKVIKAVKSAMEDNFKLLFED